MNDSSRSKPHRQHTPKPHTRNALRATIRQMLREGTIDPHLGGQMLSLIADLVEIEAICVETAAAAEASAESAPGTITEYRAIGQIRVCKNIMEIVRENADE